MRDCVEEAWVLAFVAGQAQSRASAARKMDYFQRTVTGNVAACGA